MNNEILKNLTILYVEDDEFIRENTVITLSMLELNVISAIDGEDGVDKFHKNSNIDFILTDISMPNMNGLDMIEEIKKTKEDIPVIITTAHQEISYLHRAIELHVNSYIMKPIDISNLIKALINAVEPSILKHQLISKNKELIELNNSLEEKIELRTRELRILASTDPLTGINNRREFFKLANELFAISKENDLFAVMIDIDNFKLLNDTYGHSIGDEVLILLTKTIKDLLKENEIFGRLGGEEFAIVYKLDSNKDSYEKINSIRQIVENLHFENGKSQIKFTISVGISQKTKEDTLVDSILARADKALYEAKGSGRNKVIFRNKDS